ncbi:hypothetical protein SPBR_08025 [Sporothrix brasiliensis 5110]|uniref:Uncharacterized protein n=1 Tax=Sporothrix brasiliensis 5110 TaxID=1398154 RepID=A0A0C2FDY5_9PEZI|nr:uncharacterized protein SPBR_08025 [Sporothrix brasiliensis 5110]KIH89348.1 hypothetical protein SPBR_08025 [Sporothrix brasiliensis 5110]
MAHTDHHCPGRKGKNGCRRIKLGKLSFCRVHQIACLVHMFYHMRWEPCAKCRGNNRVKATADEPVKAVKTTKKRQWSFWKGGKKGGKKN